MNTANASAPKDGPAPSGNDDRLNRLLHAQPQATLALLSAHQDLGLRSRMGAAFGFFMAIAFGISALVTAMRSNLPFAPAICVVVLCSETWLILRRVLRPRSNRNSQ